ncbi:MAG TPA: hypothetical protein VGD91_07300 [Trebonia sp.]
MTAERETAGSPESAVRPAAGQPPRLFTAELRTAVRYEAGLAVKAAAVLAALAVFLVLRALYFSLAGRGGKRADRNGNV